MKQVHCDDGVRVTATARPSSDNRMSQLTEENRSLRLRLADSSSGPLGQNVQQTYQDAAQIPQAGSSSVPSRRQSSSATSPHSWGSDGPADGESERPSMEGQSRIFDLTSASVLEDAPGKFRESQNNFGLSFAGSFPTDSGLSSQHLETEAAKQRASSLRPN